MTGRKPRRTVVLVTVSLGVIVVPVLLAIAGYVLGDQAQGDPFLEVPKDTSKGCVENTDYMRFHHMALLRALRDRTVRDGKPSEVTFDTCRACHPSRERFCNKCHEAASVRPDCFGCHDYPVE